MISLQTDKTASSLSWDEDEDEKVEETKLVEDENEVDEDEIEAKASKRSCCLPSQCGITAEPVLILYSMSWGIRGPQTANLIYQKLCWLVFALKSLYCV